MKGNVMDTDVVIVGAGPVGLSLAFDLGRRGVRCTLIERKPAPEFLPKMERCNARTMEMFRRVGLADKIRAAGLRSDCPMDVFLVKTLVDEPLLHLTYPSVDEARDDIASVNDGFKPLEPYQLISQYTLEPLLKAEVERFDMIDVRYGCAFETFIQDQAGVTATVQENGRTSTITCQYLVGCDGGGSRVRRQLGIKLRGEANILKLRQGLFVCDELYDRLPMGHGPGHGRHYHRVDDKATFLIMQDSRRHWSLHAVVDSAEEMKTQFETIVGAHVKYEMLYCGEWQQNLMLADKYAQGRVYLAGDSAHLVIPTGGLGMNTGVGDAFDLSWKLHATLQGWGGPALLASYEVERRQVGERNISASRYASLGRRKWRSQWRPDMFDETEVGRAARDNLITVAEAEQRKTNEMIGAELGYRYIDSPVIDNMPGGPEHILRAYQPTTWPGARLPHVWREDGRAMQDDLPRDGYVLLRLGGTIVATGALEAAIRARGAPLTVLTIPDAVAAQVYERDLLLLRPDMHVVWRGNAAPEDPEEIAAIATGHRMVKTAAQMRERVNG
jgi:2-polyprenyl-6-methoxyphenol hydroxylase-like FAD-dependent oxidoreductase